MKLVALIGSTLTNLVTRSCAWNPRSNLQDFQVWQENYREAKDTETVLAFVSWVEEAAALRPRAAKGHEGKGATCGTFEEQPVFSLLLQLLMEEGSQQVGRDAVHHVWKEVAVRTLHIFHIMGRLSMETRERVEIKKKKQSNNQNLSNDLFISWHSLQIGQDHSLCIFWFSFPLGFFNSALEVVWGRKEKHHTHKYHKMHATQRFLGKRNKTHLRCSFKVEILTHSFDHAAKRIVAVVLKEVLHLNTKVHYWSTSSRGKIQCTSTNK